MRKPIVRLFGIILLFLVNLTIQAQGQTDQNHTPVVKILKPGTDKSLSPNTWVPYAITVNDVEDGHSDYEEIAEREVLLLVKYLKDASLINDYLTKIEQDLKPLMAMGKSTCLNCHAANTKLIGPSFDLIARKHSTNKKARSYLSEKIIQGGSGVWGDEKMPPHPNLSSSELALIVDWILRQDKEPSPFYVGLEGAVRIPEVSADSGGKTSVWTAAYKDHGSASSPENQKLGLHTISLKMKP